MGGDVEVLEKRDGSLLIVSQYKGDLIHRTRGTFDASNLENGFEIKILKERYPQAFELVVDAEGTADYSLLFEWETPLNQIVVRHDDLNLVLIGGVRHKDYSYLTQGELDLIASEKGLSRPKRFSFENPKDMLEEVSQWKGIEGVVVYSLGGQTMRKVKSEDYLRLHRLKSELASIGKVAEFYVSANTPSFEEAFKTIEVSLDFEVAERSSSDLQKVVDAWNEVQNQMALLEQIVAPYREEPRKEAALFIQSLNKEDWGLAFKILDRKELSDRDKVKLIENKLN